GGPWAYTNGTKQPNGFSLSNGGTGNHLDIRCAQETKFCRQFWILCFKVLSNLRPVIRKYLGGQITSCTLFEFSFNRGKVSFHGLEVSDLLSIFLGIGTEILTSCQFKILSCKGQSFPCEGIPNASLLFVFGLLVLIEGRFLRGRLLDQLGIIRSADFKGLLFLPILGRVCAIVLLLVEFDSLQEIGIISISYFLHFQSSWLVLIDQ